MKLQPFQCHIYNCMVFVDRKSKIGYINGKKEIEGLNLEQTLIEVGNILVEKYNVPNTIIMQYWEMIVNEY